MWNLKINDANKLIYKTETGLQTQRMNLWLQGRRMRGSDTQGVWDGHVYIAIFKTDNQQGPTVQDMELCSVLYSSLEKDLGEKGYMYMYG